jgi:hypothetical protein
MNEEYNQHYKLEPVDITGPSEPQSYQDVPRDSNISAQEEELGTYNQPGLSM